MTRVALCIAPGIGLALVLGLILAGMYCMDRTLCLAGLALPFIGWVWTGYRWWKWTIDSREWRL